MNSEKLRTQIGNNIAAFRRQCDMTQAELADRLNYSDKAVSKWERGESVPDVITLVQIAEEFGVTLNDLTGSEEKTLPEKTTPIPQKRYLNKRAIQMLVSLLVWFVAALVYVILSSMDIPKSWIGFLYAVPVNAIVLLCLRSAWRRYNLNQVLISLIVWGGLFSLYASMLIFAGFNIWKLFLLGLLGQVAIFVWFRIFKTPKDKVA